MGTAPCSDLKPLLQVLAEGMEALDAVNEDMACACQTAFESMYREILYAARAKARAALSAVEAEVLKMEGAGERIEDE
jgi:hypothetical protein